MADLVGLARLALAAVFAVAAVAKLQDRGASRNAVAGLGVPAGLAAPVAHALPIVELAFAGGLLLAPAARAAAGAAVVVLLVFTVTIGVNLAHGNRPPCNCFGQVNAAPIGPATLVRNIALAGVAVVVLAAGPGSLGRAWVVAACLSAAMLAWRLRPGASGSAFARSLVVSGLPAVVIFTSARCISCASLEPEIEIWRNQHAGALSFTVLDCSHRIARRLGCTITPAAVVVAPDSATTSPLVIGAEAIRDLVTNAGLAL